jgi:hypothetical protein
MYNDFNKLLDSFKPASATSVISGPGDKDKAAKKAAKAKDKANKARQKKKEKGQKQRDKKAARAKKNHCKKKTGCRANVMTGGKGRR